VADAECSRPFPSQTANIDKVGAQFCEAKLQSATASVVHSRKHIESVEIQV
jgi:hypothetical protein